jgi:hypothetical protein
MVARDLLLVLIKVDTLESVILSAARDPAQDRPEGATILVNCPNAVAFSNRAVRAVRFANRCGAHSPELWHHPFALFATWVTRRANNNATMR